MNDTEAMATMVADAIERATEPLHNRISTLERQKTVVGSSGLTQQVLSDLLKGIAETTREFVHEQLRPLTTKIAQLEQRLAAWESQPKSLDFRGVWQRAQTYNRNQGVTHSSSLWLCLEDNTTSQPGTDPARWQLASKGRD